MAKEKITDKEERRRGKKEKKEKRSDTDGVHKSKKDKKEKKKIADVKVDVVRADMKGPIGEDKPPSITAKENGDAEVVGKAAPLLAALVPFANPLADEKVGRKVLKGVKKGQ